MQVGSSTTLAWEGKNQGLDCLTKRLKPLILNAHGWRLKLPLDHRSPPIRTQYIQGSSPAKAGFGCLAAVNRLGAKIYASTR